MAAVSSGMGIMARGEKAARESLIRAVADLGLQVRGEIEFRPLPFEGQWGAASSISHALAGELVMQELAASGKLEGLSKKEARQLASSLTRDRAQLLADQIAALMPASDTVASVNAVNGFINISFNANAVAFDLIQEVLAQGDAYGRGAPRPERVMVEHSQPNTHKTFHVGHLRNTVLGSAVSNITAAAGYPVLQATYPGDIGMHVIKALWAYERFYKDQEPADAALRGRWLGQIYAESDARLNYRDDLMKFLHLLATEDLTFVTAIDKMLKALWRTGVEGEDIAYLFGRMTQAKEIKTGMLLEDDIIPKFWSLAGEQLRQEVVNQRPHVPVEGEPEPVMTPDERMARWEELNATIDWWSDGIAWRDEVRQTFQRWEIQEPEFVQLWRETRQWSLDDFQRIFDELGAHFDVWFFESEVEETGKEIVKELLQAGIAEISDGLTVVKIDEKLGLEEETYRTLPILRSDGTSLYSTKDLALTRQKFEEFDIDRAIWVVDVRQSLYFQQIFKILELWGFEQAKDAWHLPYEMVVLPEGVISSRKGNAPLYDDVRDLVLARARAIIEEKNPELPLEQKDQVARDVTLGSLKFAMLARDNNKVVVFDIDEALSFEGYSAPYVQYAHARANRILEHAGWTGSTAQEAARTGSQPLDFGDISTEELDLLQQIAQYPEDVQRAADQHRPLLIANYVFELARKFNDFYHARPVLKSDEPLRTARLALVDATRITLANGLGLLGIAAPREM